MSCGNGGSKKSGEIRRCRYIPLHECVRKTLVDGHIDDARRSTGVEVHGRHSEVQAGLDVRDDLLGSRQLLRTIDSNEH